MFVHDEPPSCGAYLPRNWEVRSDRPGQPSAWLFSLEEAGTGERHGFHDLEARELGCEAAGAAGGREDEKE